MWAALVFVVPFPGRILRGQPRDPVRAPEFKSDAKTATVPAPEIPVLTTLPYPVRCVFGQYVKKEDGTGETYTEALLAPIPAHMPTGFLVLEQQKQQGKMFAPGRTPWPVF